MNVESSSPKVSTYDGPTVNWTLVLGGREVHLVRPQDPDRLLEDPEVHAWNRQDDYMPYWAYLWPGAYFLAEAVAREAEPEGGWRPGMVEALEIGCGLGLAGLLAVGRGWHVTFSDYDEAALDFVRRSAAANGFDASVYATRLLDWRDPPDEQFPIILGADVLYERRLVPLVASLLHRMLAPDGHALIAGPYRVATAGFARALAQRGLKCADEPVAAISHEQGPIRGTLYRVWK
jgi:predicted nicotinamide N-methyase